MSPFNVCEQDVWRDNDGIGISGSTRCELSDYRESVVCCLGETFEGVRGCDFERQMTLKPEKGRRAKEKAATCTSILDIEGLRPRLFTNNIVAFCSCAYDPYLCLQGFDTV